MLQMHWQVIKDKCAWQEFSCFTLFSEQLSKNIMRKLQHTVTYGHNSTSRYLSSAPRKKISATEIREICQKQVAH